MNNKNLILILILGLCLLNELTEIAAIETTGLTSDPDNYIRRLTEVLDRFDNVEVEPEMAALLEEIKDDIERAERSEDYDNLSERQKKKLNDKKELIDHILQDTDNPDNTVAGEHTKTFVMFEKHPDQKYGITP